MVAFGHMGVGALVGSAVAITASPSTALPLKLALVIVLAWLSHYLTDFIPHGHYRFEAKHLKKRVPPLFVLDAGGGLVLFCLVTLATVGFSTSALLVITGMVVALGPDILEGLIDLKYLHPGQLLKSHRHFHQKFLHWHNVDGRSRKWGMADIWQVVTGIVALLVVGTLPG